MARSLAAKGETEDAEAVLRKIIDGPAEVAPEHQKYSIDVPLAQGRAHFLLGLIEESRGHQARALDHHLAAYNEEPEQEVFWSAALCLLARAGRYDDASNCSNIPALSVRATRRHWTVWGWPWPC